MNTTLFLITLAMLGAYLNAGILNCHALGIAAGVDNCVCLAGYGVPAYDDIAELVRLCTVCFHCMNPIC